MGLGKKEKKGEWKNVKWCKQAAATNYFTGGRLE